MSDVLIGVIIGGIIATVAPIVVEVIRGKREQDLDTAKRADDRRIGRDAFQRETLLELMEAVTAWRAAIRAFWDEQLLNMPANDSKWPVGWSGEIDSQIDGSLSRVILLRERVLDDDVRRAVATATDLTRDMLHARSLEDAQGIYVDVIAEANLAIEAAGQAVRKLYR